MNKCRTCVFPTASSTTYLFNLCPLQKLDALAPISLARFTASILCLFQLLNSLRFFLCIPIFSHFLCPVFHRSISLCVYIVPGTLYRTPHSTHHAGNEATLRLNVRRHPDRRRWQANARRHGPSGSTRE